MKRLSKDDYTVGWLCALPNPEWKASRLLLDEEHAAVRLDREARYQYVYGEMSGHNVVMGCLPSSQIGEVSAAHVAAEMLRTFRSIRFYLLVGVGGGVPSTTPSTRFGDVVVSQPSGEHGHGGVIQWDAGKWLEEGEFRPTGFLNRPPDILLAALARVQATPNRLSRFHHYLTSRALLDEWPSDFPPDWNTDPLRGELEKQRPPRTHYGLIASGNCVIKDAAMRDRINARSNNRVLCFEMEAAGLMSQLPCLVIRGICDYCDSRKNKRWQPYAAAAAAAWAKELLRNIALLPGKGSTDGGGDSGSDGADSGSDGVDSGSDSGSDPGMNRGGYSSNARRPPPHSMISAGRAMTNVGGDSARARPPTGSGAHSGDANLSRQMPISRLNDEKPKLRIPFKISDSLLIRLASMGKAELQGLLSRLESGPRAILLAYLKESSHSTSRQDNQVEECESADESDDESSRRKFVGTASGEGRRRLHQQ